jgi:putative transposase
MKPPPDPGYRHRFPAEIITHAVWLYHVFSLSLRDVELLLAIPAGNDPYSSMVIDP